MTALPLIEQALGDHACHLCGIAGRRVSASHRFALAGSTYMLCDEHHAVESAHQKRSASKLAALEANIRAMRVLAVNSGNDAQVRVADEQLQQLEEMRGKL